MRATKPDDLSDSWGPHGRRGLTAEGWLYGHTRADLCKYAPPPTNTCFNKIYSCRHNRVSKESLAASDRNPMWTLFSQKKDLILKNAGKDGLEMKRGWVQRLQDTTARSTRTSGRLFLLSSFSSTDRLLEGRQGGH